MVFWEAFGDKFNAENADVSYSFEAIDIARGEANFMKEILWSYAFRDTDMHKVMPNIEWKISILAATPEGSELRGSSHQLLRRNTEKLYFTTDMKKHIEMKDLSISSHSIAD